MSMPTKQPESGALARAVSAEVRAAMGRHRISGMQLASLTGKSQNYIATRLRDESPFTVNDIQTICDALGEDYLQLWANAVTHLGEK
jgi:transcriptional regulator with XRE-family HTH domain